MTVNNLTDLLLLKRFSPRQRQALLYLALLLCLCLFLWVLLAPGYNAFNYYRARGNIERLEAENMELQKNITALRQEIDRLSKDKAYLEKVAREEFGLLRKNETIYKFEKNESGKGK